MQQVRDNEDPDGGGFIKFDSETGLWMVESVAGKGLPRPFGMLLNDRYRSVRRPNTQATLERINKATTASSSMVSEMMDHLRIRMTSTA
jgi:hypothetical protein